MFIKFDYYTKAFFMKTKRIILKIVKNDKCATNYVFNK